MKSSVLSLKNLLFSYSRLRHYSVSKQDGKLRISLSRVWFYRCLLLLIVVSVLSLAVFVYLYLNFPPVEKRWLALVVCAVVGASMIGMMLLIMAMGLRAVYIFDLQTGRVLRRKSVLCRTSEINRLEIIKNDLRSGRDERYTLQLIFLERKRLTLFHRSAPADELFEIAETLGEYVGARVAKPT